MTKLLATLLATFALAACSNMSSRPTTMGAPGETKNSMESNKSGNSSAVSPAGAGGGGAGAGAGAMGR